MAQFLLDTNVIIDYVRKVPHATATLNRVVALGDELCVSDVILAEIWTGTFPAALGRTEALLRISTFLPMSAAAAERAGRWRFDYARRGITLSLADAMIAAVGEEHQATIVTSNVRHFPMPEIRLLQPRA